MKRGAIIITAVEGKAVIIKPGATESKNAAKGQALQQGEKIITDKKSTVSLAFENGSVIQVEQGVWLEALEAARKLAERKR